QIYLKCKDVGLREIYDNISKRIGKHLLRTGKEFVERKAVVVNMIGEIRDLNYITELITILWEPGIFNEAREALIKFANDAVEPLLGVLKDAEDRSVRMKILDVLVRMGNVIVPSVLKLLGDQEWYIRRNGLYLLGQLKAEDTIDAIGEMIKDENELVQVEAVCALGNISGEKVKPYLREALNSKYLSVSLEAARYLPRAEVRSVIPRFLKMLERRKRIPDKKEETMRRDVIRVIGEIGGDEVIETLVQVIKDRSLLGTDLLLTTKEVAIEALGQIGTPKALDALNELALSSDEKIVSMVEGVITKIKFKSQQLDHK
ncbi:MAG: HEAT repeat domain-containing protein, partial [candidate division WOR-3 bacterium]